MRLYELNNIAATVIKEAFPDELWVEGELSEGRKGGGGHFYGELIEKSDDGVVLARARVTIWARTYRILAMRFKMESGQELRAGLHIRLLVDVTFHEAYGYSLNVRDIDSRFTLGDQAQRRLRILRQLEEDGIIDDNKELPLPRLLQRIAVISSPTAAGLGDFMDQLHHNDYGLAFLTHLFPSLMQGAQAAESIINQLSRIDTTAFDCIVIIRGGGATSDLSDFDHYALASCVAQCPVPVIVGIGHERDETVLDYVAHLSLKTPTAVASFIIDHQMRDLALIDDIVKRLPRAVRVRLLEERHRVDTLMQSISITASRHLERQRHFVDMIEQRLRGLNPSLLLERGYSITMCDGHLVNDVSKLHEGDNITTRLISGEIFSIIKKVKCNTSEHEVRRSNREA